GFVDRDRPAQIWTIAVPAPDATPSSLKRITAGEFPTGNYRWSADGSHILFVADRRGESYYYPCDSDIYAVPKVGREAKTSGGHAGPIWSRDGRSLLIKVGEQGSTNLKRVDVASGRIESVTTGHHEVMSYTADAGASTIAFVRSTPTVLGDLYVADAASPAAPKQLTKFNDDLFGQLAMNEPEEIWYTSFDGKKIQGWILKPPSFDPSTKYPLILEIHGGPHSAYGNT